jgi:hypothetical protein
MPATVKIVWTEEEDAHLLKLRRLGYSNERIAESVGRPRSTVGHRVLKLIADLSPEQLAAMGDPKTDPVEPPPVLRADVLSHRAIGWTDAMDEQITELRNGGMSYRKIGLVVGRHESTVWDRLMKLAEQQTAAPGQPAAARVAGKPRGRADFFRRPAGPVPANPDPPASPRDPGYRKCLGADCGKFFWSPSAAVRICPNCKKNASRPDGYGNGRAIADTSEFVLRL